MEPEFWHQRWQNNEIGFHQETVNPYLQRYWSRLQLQAGARVLVPCCGKSQDLLWLQGQGLAVLGIEISPLAVAAFFSEHGLQPDIRRQGDYKVSSSDGLQLFCGDFFKLTATDIDAVAAVYDRAAMIAMPAPMRRAYCQHLQAITSRQVPIMLVTMEYPADEMQGPPFSVTERDIQAAYASAYTIEVLETRDILPDNPFFQDKGLTRLQERVYLLIPA